MSIYLDYNASTPLNRRVLEVMNDVYINHYGNPDSRTHEEGIAAHEIVENARKQVAHLLGRESYEVYFTSGSTESNNLAILGMAQWGKENGKTHIISSSIEHKSILEPLKALEQTGFVVDYVTPDRDGRIRPEQILERVNEHTLMVCTMHANNETGVIQPVKEIGDELRSGQAYFLLDCAQTCGKLVDEVRDVFYDFLSVSAHKLHGPQGIGILAIRRRNYILPPIHPILLGGGQENGLRPGTVPVALAAGMGCAAEIAEGNYQRWKTKTLENKAHLIEALKNSTIKYTVNGTQEHCMSNTLNVSFEGVNSEALMLAMKGICSFSNGSACTAKDYAYSYVLDVMGLPEPQLESAVRLSWDIEDISEGVRDLIQVVSMLQGAD